jgi:hypothetical protein
MWLAAKTVVAASHIKSVSVAVYIVSKFLLIFSMHVHDLQQYFSATATFTDQETSKVIKMLKNDF